MEKSSPEPLKKTVFFNIRLDPEMHEALTALAVLNERTIAGEIRVAIRSHLSEAEAPGDEVAA